MPVSQVSALVCRFKFPQPHPHRLRDFQTAADGSYRQSPVSFLASIAAAMYPSL